MDDSQTTQQNETTPILGWEVPYIGKHIICVVIAVCVLFIGISAWAFFWGREQYWFDEGYVLDNDLWGTLGDFVGGTLGTLLALLSFLMMYWTLKAQRELTSQTNQMQERLQRELNGKAATLQTELNNQAVRQAELQRFNDLFFELLGLYHRQKKELDSLYDDGISFFNVHMEIMQNHFSEYVTFARAWRYAKDKYITFYLENSTQIAPLFRTLYRLFLITDNAPIDNNKKLDYAKTVRAQLSEGELFFLRYNCLTGYGSKFCDLINKYRVTKHLPFLSLLENTSLRNKLTSHKGINHGLALNWLIYSLSEEIYNRLVGKVPASRDMKEFQKNSRYELSFSVDGKTTVIVRLRISMNHRNNTPAMRCLDQLDLDTIEKMLLDFLREMFLFSNSKVYNDENLLKFSSKNQTLDNIHTIWSIVTIHKNQLRVSHPIWDSYYGICS